MPGNAERPAIIWFRHDLRLSDNEALTAAADSDRPVLACYVLGVEGAAPRRLGGASRWWLHRSLERLAARVAERGGRLILRRGSAAQALDELVAATGAVEVHCSAALDRDGGAEQDAVRAALAARGLELRCHPGSVLFSPDAIRTLAGKPFRVFTPFWKACLAAEPQVLPRPEPRGLRFATPDIGTETLASWRLLPEPINWAAGLEEHWIPGEDGAHKRLERFTSESLDAYETRRDRPDFAGTSRLSPYLRFGELSPRQIWHAVRQHETAQARTPGASFLRELGWREFSYHLLAHWPDLAQRPFRPEFEAFPWHDDEDALGAWQRGETGYPIVDAGMRELWATGWMHNRVRMIVASFLVKDLLVPWQRGEAWFWDTLVDADPANNAASWQWVAGCGADAAPYFRIFNPVLQGKKFDPAGRYVRRWIPELGELESKYVHEPWAARAGRLAKAGIDLGRSYPMRIVDHAEARHRALAAYKHVKGQQSADKRRGRRTAPS